MKRIDQDPPTIFEFNKAVEITAELAQADPEWKYQVERLGADKGKIRVCDEDWNVLGYF